MHTYVKYIPALSCAVVKTKIIHVVYLVFCKKLNLIDPEGFKIVLGWSGPKTSHARDLSYVQRWRGPRNGIDVLIF
jgi:hypothetical protein